ncbi:MAG: hypothetical protein BGO05_26230 [Rhizobiales bacterium 63-7]|nr:hypothetical protein [Hyphomicrobiales bacterium]OJU67010.1 MAG: hypothetical protein BGO05_26230 [Rhizobiales bacterium 63-7]
MNLRILKKLCKRAAPLLLQLGDDREQFPSEKWENYHGTFIGDRKHWDRGRCHPSYEGRNGWGTPRGAEVVFTTRAGRRIVMGPPVHPRKGTIMVGAPSGYYEPEWDEQCAWSALESLVLDHFTDWDLVERWQEREFASEDAEKFEWPVGGALTRDLSSVSLIFAAAREIIAGKGGAA